MFINCTDLFFIVSLNKDGSHRRVVGSTLTLRNVSRYCSDVYRCVADNGVSPSVSRRIPVTVECKQVCGRIRVHGLMIRKQLFDVNGTFYIYCSLRVQE
jgi:hypothetical protein